MVLRQHWAVIVFASGWPGREFSQTWKWIRRGRRLNFYKIRNRHELHFLYDTLFVTGYGSGNLALGQELGNFGGFGPGCPYLVLNLAR
jgi:hypothetical protein